MVWVMAGSLGARGHRVLEKSFRRPPADRAEVVDEVGLVVVAARVLDPSPIRTGGRLGERTRMLEAQQPGVRLRRHSDLVAEARDDPLAAPTELGCERADGDTSARLLQPVPGPPHARIGLRSIGKPSPQERVEDAESLGPRALGVHAL